MRTKNKKAIVLPETLKLIIGVLCILALLYLAWSLYGIFITKSKLAQAKETLNQIVAEVKSLEDGEKGDYLVTGPKGWGLVGSNYYYYEEKMPDNCIGKNCLCVCEKYSDHGIWKYDCDKRGACKEIENQLTIRETSFDDKEKPDPIQSNVNFLTYISFDEIPINLFIKKEGSDVFISDREKDKEIVNQFLDKEIEFEGEKMSVKALILDKLFSKCSKQWGSGKMEVEENLKKFIEDESKKYLNELINANKIKGGKIVFTATHRVFTKNPIVVLEGDTKTCSVLEEREICFNEINKNTADPHGIIAAYLRFYVC